LHIIARTNPTPSLPYICATRFDAARVAAAVQNAFTSLEQNQKSQMRLHGFIRLSTDEYLSVPSPTSPDKLFS
jgi:ABC-type phosphate/phosphonate transport system substrate-binding protein